MDHCIDQDSEFESCLCKYQRDDDTCCNFEEFCDKYRKGEINEDFLNLVCIPARIELFCKENNVGTCRNTPHPCPCKFLTRDILYADILFCNFAKMYAELMYYQVDRKVKVLLDTVCPLIKNELLYHEFIADETVKSERNFLTKSEIGQEVYCTTEYENVILLQKPNKVGGKCKYKTSRGKVDEQWTFCFRTLSRGDTFSEYEVRGKDFEKRAKNLELLAKANGLRVEIEPLNESCLLRIFGDSQEEVEDFITICCNNDFILY